MHLFLPSGIPLPTAQNVREEATLAAAIGEVEQDMDEVKDLPATRPEEDEVEEEGSKLESAPDDPMPADQQAGEANAANTEQ